MKKNDIPCLRQDGFADRLRQVTSADEVIEAFNIGEEEAQAEEATKAQAVKEAVSSDKPLIVAVTGLYDRYCSHLHG